MSEKTQHITSIGGQAILEGVMMRGPFKTAYAVRKPDGEIETKVDETGVKKHNKFLRLPIVRGCINFFDSLIVGMKALMYSAEFIDIEEDGEEEEESKFDRWLEDKLGDKLKDVVIYVAIAFSLIMSVGLFILLPTLVTSGIEWLFAKIGLEAVANARIFTGLVEGVVRMAIFIGYLALTAQMSDMKRTYEYHGAEHKTIACYEAGEELTPENVKKYTRFHPRCGTSFLMFVVLISIIVYSIMPRFDASSYVMRILLRMGTRLLFLPLIAGISYEIIKLAGRSQNKCVKLLSKPGLWMQRITTREPDEKQIAVAIASIEPVIPENREDDKW